MNESGTIGARIRALRTKNHYTLKQLSEQTGLSIGFLSQLERGMSSVAVDSLQRIAGVLGVGLSDFFAPEDIAPRDGPVRSFDVPPAYITPHIVSYVHSHDVQGFDHLPRVYCLLPLPDAAGYEPEMYSHDGEEFIYVLEGIVTVYAGGRRHDLYPGDSIQLKSDIEHNWMNRTGRAARFLAVNMPNPVKAGEQD